MEGHGGLLDQAGVERLGDAAVAKLLVGSGSLIGLSVAVELAGFSAYILAAKASAIIPFIGGKTLVSGLFVLTNPLFVVPALLGGGYLVSAKLEASIRRGLSMSAAAILALRGLAGGRTAADRMTEVFRDAGVHATTLEGTDTGSRFTAIFGHRDAPEPAVVHLHPPRLAEYRRQSLALARHVTVPASAADWSGFDRPLGGKDGDAIKNLLFRRSGPDGRPDGRAAAIDTAGLAALTLGDIIYNAASINPTVLEALRQCQNPETIPHVEGFKSIFSLGPYADHLADKAEASAAGAVNRLKGYVGEQYVAAKLKAQDKEVSIPDTSNEPGYDLLVDGKEFQVKTRLDLDGVREHFDKNPDIPVYVNAELVDKAAESGEWWAGHVFSVEGFSHEYITDLTERAVAAGGDLVDNHLVEIPVFATAIAAARNTFRWHQGQIPLEDIAWNVAVEGASKGSLSVVGGFAGKTLGMLIFGPAGAVVFAGVGAVAATTQSGWLVRRLDRALDAERDAQVRARAAALLEACEAGLRRKTALIENKRRQLGDGIAAAYVAARLGQDIAFLEERLGALGMLCERRHDTGEAFAFAAVDFAQRSTVHLVWLQDQYAALLDLQTTPKRRAATAARWVRSKVEKGIK